MSTKLKLMGVDVASFGNCFADEKTAKAITYEDPFKGSYKKLLFNLDGTHLLGGILVGDASEYGTLSMLAKSSQALAMTPSELLLGKTASTRAPGSVLTSIPNDAQVCSCNNVSKAQICDAIREKNLCSVDEVKTLHQGRHRLRRLPAAGHRPVQGRRSRRPARRSTPPSASISPARARNCSRSSRSSGSRPLPKC